MHGPSIFSHKTKERVGSLFLKTFLEYQAIISCKEFVFQCVLLQGCNPYYINKCLTHSIRSRLTKILGRESSGNFVWVYYLWFLLQNASKLSYVFTAMILILNRLCNLIKIESEYEYLLWCRCKAWLKFSQIWKSWYFSNEFIYLESVLSRFNNYIYQSFTKSRSWGWWLKENNCKRYIIFNLVILTRIKFLKGTDFVMFVA